MKTFRFAIILLVITVATLSAPSMQAASSEYDDKDAGSGGEKVKDANSTVFQTSTLEALLLGKYDGNMKIGELREHGGFGLGTYDRLDGEMIALDGVFYQVKSDGTAHRAGDSVTTPFAVVTRFSADETTEVNGNIKCAGLKEDLLELFATRNIIYALKVSGEFSYLKTRSVPAQEKPYPPLSDVVKEEAVFEFENISGTIVGFWMPEYMENLNQPGFHFHFISDDGKSGGHVLDCTVHRASAGIDYLRDIDVSLPDTEEFNKAELNRNPGK